VLGQLLFKGIVLAVGVAKLRFKHLHARIVEPLGISFFPPPVIVSLWRAKKTGFRACGVECTSFVMPSKVHKQAQELSVKLMYIHIYIYINICLYIYIYIHVIIYYKYIYIYVDIEGL
jgi:hypothetical protein